MGGFLLTIPPVLNKRIKIKDVNYSMNNDNPK